MKGLYAKYLVFKSDAPIADLGGVEPLDGCFVLRPEKDMAARGALRVYALLTDDSSLAKSLNVWLDGLPPL